MELEFIMPAFISILSLTSYACSCVPGFPAFQWKGGSWSGIVFGRKITTMTTQNVYQLIIPFISGFLFHPEQDRRLFGSGVYFQEPRLWEVTTGSGEIKMVLQWNLSNPDLVGTQSNCPDYWGVLINFRGSTSIQLGKGWLCMHVIQSTDLWPPMQNMWKTFLSYWCTCS